MGVVAVPALRPGRDTNHFAYVRLLTPDEAVVALWTCCSAVTGVPLAASATAPVEEVTPAEPPQPAVQ